ncbi:MAG TPA: aminotransferase class I/II-fold pyridoxal phosphate-dependent enzyme [Aggregatilineales bacterium]|nr:aminotransferase class I/II-fold pyridoxal phosphate-dependent enzyme [Anaerolineales bacterium]HRE46172.1 aminotransferase class I/II-fold pyridoxal phosphate-dependent enzyme [Aggregatilineales bacterium]
MTSSTPTRTLPPVADRLRRLPPYGFAILGQKIAEMTTSGKDVIRVDIGSPDMPPPPHVIEALREAVQDPTKHGYGSYRGHKVFREAVANYYQRRFGITLNEYTEILPLIGSKEGIINLTLAYVDHGDYAIVPDLNYPAYSMGTIMAGGDVILMRLDPARGYLPDLDALRRNPNLSKAKVLWVNYPNNPTGAVADLSVYQELVAFCREHHLLLCSDNPYAEVVFDGYRAVSALQADPDKSCTVEFMSLSKFHNMAGWRLGACVGNKEAIDALLVIKSNIDSGHFRPIYDAGAAALNHTPESWVNERNAIYQARRDKLLAVCPEIGLEPFKTPASLYVWVRVKDGDDQAYTNDALENALVSITPGTMYGEAGRGYLRFSIGVSDDRLDEAISRLKGWYSRRQG